jgi:hypothetical protein
LPSPLCRVDLESCMRCVLSPRNWFIIVAQQSRKKLRDGKHADIYFTASCLRHNGTITSGIE